jgi:hypothetical protein
MLPEMDEEVSWIDKEFREVAVHHAPLDIKREEDTTRALMRFSQGMQRRPAFCARSDVGFEDARRSEDSNRSLYSDGSHFLCLHEVVW